LPLTLRKRPIHKNEAQRNDQRFESTPILKAGGNQIQMEVDERVGLDCSGNMTMRVIHTDPKKRNKTKTPKVETNSSRNIQERKV